MANQKLKEESYTQIGGLNTKASAYMTQPQEFLGLINYDFQTPGAITQRWGSTQYIGQTFPGSINALFEYTQLTGFSQILVGATGGVWAGANQTSLNGVSFTNFGATLAYGTNWFVTMFQIGAGITYLVNIGVGAFNNSPMRWGGGGTFYLDPIASVDNTLSFAVMDNFLFMADGNKFLKYDGITTTLVSLPYVALGTTGTGAGTGVQCSLITSNTIGIPAAVGVTGTFFYYLTYLNSRGFEGPLTPVVSCSGQMTGSSLAAAGGTLVSIGLQVATPLQYGISTINQYVYFDSGNGLSLSFFNFDPIFLKSTPASGSTQTFVPIGSTAGGATFQLLNIGSFYDNTNYFPLGSTVVITPNSATFSSITPSEIDQTAYYPSILSNYANTLFAAGFSLTPSTVAFSDPTEPEGFVPDNQFEVRTDDGDIITNMIPFQTRHYIFKKNSFHILTGNDPTNFFIQEASAIYGCVNKKSAVVFGQMLVFLDRKGLISYNGSQINENFSYKIQSFFDQMNYVVALKTACMTYDKLRNQVLCAIPINGSLFNNLTIVYDCALQSWTTYQGFNPSIFANIQGVNNTRYPFYGDTSGRVNIQGPSLLSDNGVGATLYFKTRFFHAMGESVEKQFRRMYINADPISGVTLSLPTNFYQDFGSSIVYGTTVSLGEFQTRIDYGIPAKAIAFEIFANPTIQVIRFYGFTIEERLQRNT